METFTTSVGEDQLSMLRLEHWPIHLLVPSPRNARTHSDAQVAEIAGSIRAFGFSNPILVGDDKDVIAGHGRLAAARLLGLSEVPVIVLAGLSEVQRRQLMLADNRIAMNAGWDAELLQLELQDLSAIGADLSGLGFTKKELAVALSPLGEGGLTDENDIPALSDSAVTHPNDIWCLGDHRIACGDSTDVETVAALLGSAEPILMVTDPPYGVKYDPTWRHRSGVNKSSRIGKVQNDERADWSETWRLFPGTIAYVWHGALHSSTVAKSLEQQGFQIRAQIIWAKERLVIGRGDYHWQHEPCWYAVRTKGNWTGDRKQTTLWTISSGGQDTETVHGTQKPVECMRRPMLNNTEFGQAVYDPFLGSGTTLIAAETTGRVCYAMEIDPRYVDVVVRRWQAFVGRVATHAGDGQSFEDIANMRAAQQTDSSTSRDVHESYDIAPGATQTEPVELNTKSTQP
ncbi:site-specific DNA-methyltransferase [Pseudorhodoplanes sinuspersici]|uniref:Methyltransferase n=1 Tax=Pseudorhodoplanes sinuspersici TaxID=1235591 RepID=A0A1W6ZLT7_9HYPH|nr:DNA methylase [Pseudorhodoplanes sinuspersici]RKE65634.1 DNA modification methylase [Pseudorhodoplanes sinuspersici]